jgi:hypothetical protein
MIKGKAKLPDFSNQTQKPFFKVYFRGKSAMASHLTNVGNFQDDSLQVKINTTRLRSKLKRAYSLYTSSSVGSPAQKKGGRIKLLFIAVALIDNEFGSL